MTTPAGVAIVNRRSASREGILILPGTRHLDTRGVSTPPPIDPAGLSQTWR